MAPRTAVVCDTTAYLPTELVERNGITLVSLYVTLDGHEEAESELADYDDFYNRLRHSSAAATTSQPPVGKFVDAWRALLDQGREVVSIHLSANISGTYESALQAKEQLVADGHPEGAIEVVDSRSGCGGMGLAVLAAAGAARAGATPGEAATRARAAREDLKMWFAVDTLEYLKRGGRIGAASALIGSALKVKPILTLEEEITPVEKVRTRARVRERLLDYARERHEAGADAWVVQHVQDHESAEQLIGDARDVFGCEPVFCSEIGPVIGAHVGPGLVGIGSVTKTLLE